MAEEEKEFALEEPVGQLEPGEEKASEAEELLQKLERIDVLPFESGRVFNAKLVEDEILLGLQSREFEPELKTSDPTFGLSSRQSRELIERAKIEFASEMNRLSDSEIEERGIEDEIENMKAEVTNLEGANAVAKIRKLTKQHKLFSVFEESSEDTDLDALLDVSSSKPREIRKLDRLEALLEKGVESAERQNRALLQEIVSEIEAKEAEGSVTRREIELKQFIVGGEADRRLNISVLKTLKRGFRNAQSRISNPEELNGMLQLLIRDSRDLQEASEDPLRFTAELHDFLDRGREILAAQDLSIEEIDAINQNFARGLAEEIRLLIRTRADPKSVIEDIRRQISENVNNELLQEMLLNTTSRLVGQSALPSIARQPIVAEAIQQGQPARLESTLARNIIDEINIPLQQLEEAHASNIPVGGEIDSLIDALNKTFTDQGISTIGKDGMRRVKKFTKTGTIENKFRRIRKFFKDLDNPSISFFKVPVRSRVDLTSNETIIRDIRDAVKTKPRRHRQPRASRVHAAKKMGHIKIFHDHNEKLTEIVIPHITKVQDLLKLAHILSLENGELEKVTGEHLLTIKKRQTTEKQILGVLQKLFKSHSGHDFSLVLKYPGLRSMRGGLFLDSLLPVIANQSLKVGTRLLPKVDELAHRAAGSVASKLETIAEKGTGGGLSKLRGGAFVGRDINDKLHNHILDLPIIDTTHYNAHKLPVGGKVKASNVLGGLSSISSAASAFPVLAPFTIPFAALTGIAGGIAKIFGGGFSDSDLQVRRRMPHRLLQRSVSVR